MVETHGYKIGDKVRYWHGEKYYDEQLYEVRGFVDNCLVVRTLRPVRNLVGEYKYIWLVIAPDNYQRWRIEENDENI